MHLLLEAGGWAGGQPGPHQQGIPHPSGAVQVGGVSPFLARALTVLFSWELPRKIFFQQLHKRAFFVIGCDINK